MIRRPIISILIATRNRQRYAAALVKDIVSWADARLEIIIEDNSNDASLKELLKLEVKLDLVHYRFNEKAISSIDNFNNTLDIAKGHFVCLIGDDDGINPEIVTISAWALFTDIDCIAGSVKQEYIWPAVQPTGITHNGSLSYPSYSGTHQFSDPEFCGNGLACRGGTKYLELPFPRLYHGIVRKSLLDAMRLKNGYYLGGLSPDIYSAVTLNRLSRRSLIIDYPLTIPGVCPQSTTASEGKNATYSTDIRFAPHFRSRAWYVFSDRIPPVYCVDTIWADSAIAALSDMGRQQDIEAVDIDTLCAYIIRGNMGLMKAVFNWHQNRSTTGGAMHSAWKIMAGYFGQPFKTDLERARGKILRCLGINKSSIIYNISDISAARIELTLHLLHSGLCINTVLEGIKKHGM